MRMKTGESTSQMAEQEESAMLLLLPNTNTKQTRSHPAAANCATAPPSSASLSTTTLSQHEANVEAFLSKSLVKLSLSSSSTSSWRRTTHNIGQISPRVMSTQRSTTLPAQTQSQSSRNFKEVESSLSPRPRRRRRRRTASCNNNPPRSVHWGVAHIYTLPKHHHPRTSSSLVQEAEEKSRLWWQPHDYQQFANHNLSLLERFFTNNKENDNNEEEDCWRGLESLTPTEIRRRQVLRNAALDAVLEEQDVQYERDGTITPLPHGISKVYGPFSKRALQLAHKKAQEDTQSVLRMMMRNEQEEDDTSPTTRKKTASSRHPRKVQVHFHKTVQVQTGLHREDYTFQETKDVWYSSHEIQQLKGTCQQVIRAYKKQQKKKKTTKQQQSSSSTNTMVPSTEEISMRGLEPYLIMSRHDHAEVVAEKGVTARRYHVHDIWNAVLDEQERLEAAAAAATLTTPDDDNEDHHSIALALARVSQEASRACTKWALKLAQKDARFIFESGYCTQELQDYSIQSLQQQQPHLPPAATQQAASPKKTCDLMSAATASTCSSSDSSSSLGSPDAPVSSSQGMLRAESTTATSQAPTKDATASKTKTLMIGSSLDFIRDSLTFLGPPLPAALDDSTQDTGTITRAALASKRRQQVLSSQMKEKENIVANGDEDSQLPMLSLSAYSTDDSSSLLDSDEEEQEDDISDDGVHDDIRLGQASFQALKALSSSSSSSSSNPPTGSTVACDGPK